MAQTFLSVYFPSRIQETKKSKIKSKTMIMKRTKSKIRSRSSIAGSRFLISDPTLTLNLALSPLHSLSLHLTHSLVRDFCACRADVNRQDSTDKSACATPQFGPRAE